MTAMSATYPAFVGPLRTVWAQAMVEQWIDFSTTSLDAPIASWVLPMIFPGAYPYDKKARIL